MRARVIKCFKNFGICELPHIGAAKHRQGQRDVERMQMLAWIIAVVIAIGLIWSVASITKVVPVASAELLAATPPHTITAGQGKSAAVY